MALANAAAAAPVIEPVSAVAPINEAVLSLVERVLTVTLPRAADGSLGLKVESDGEGRVVVTAGREDMLEGDTVTAMSYWPSMVPRYRPSRGMSKS